MHINIISKSRRRGIIQHQIKHKDDIYHTRKPSKYRNKKTPNTS